MWRFLTSASVISKEKTGPQCINVQSWTLVQYQYHEALAVELIVTEMFSDRVVLMYLPQIGNHSTVYSPDKWEMLISLNHRTPTDASVSGEAKNRLPHSATSRVKAESQAFQGLRTLWRDNGSHRHSGARGDTIQSWESHPDDFTSSHHRDSSTQLGWSCAGNFVGVIISNEKSSQPEVAAGASDTHTLHSWAGSPEWNHLWGVRRSSLEFSWQNKHNAIGSVQTKERVLPLGHPLSGQSS